MINDYPIVYLIYAMTDSVTVCDDSDLQTTVSLTVVEGHSEENFTGHLSPVICYFWT